MRVEYTFDVVGYGECRIRTAGIDEPSPVADEDLIHVVAFFFTTAIRFREFEATRAAAHFRDHVWGRPVRLYGDQRDTQVLDELEREMDRIIRGRLLVVEQVKPVVAPKQTMPRPKASSSPTAPVAPPPVTEELPVHFELSFVDEFGDPISGLSSKIHLRHDGVQWTLSPDGGGTIRLDRPYGASTAWARLADQDAVDALRDAVKPLWDQAKRVQDRREQVIREEDAETSIVYLRAPAAQGSASAAKGDSTAVALSRRDFRLVTDEPHRVSVQPWVELARLKGLYFDTNKCFLLPTAIPYIKNLADLYRGHLAATVLVVGHTDPTGEPSVNDPLSLERAESMAAYLTDNVDAWLAWYETNKSQKQRWGAREDKLMLRAMPDYRNKPAGEDAVRWYQRTRGLSVDGVAGRETRGALIAEYMASDGTTLPTGAQLVVHGCGENFPLPEPPPEEQSAADRHSQQEHRRVELFFFDGELGIQPAPPGPNSGPGSPEYLEWVGRSRVQHELRARGMAREVTVLEMHDALFRTNSCVVLPEGEDPSRDREGHLSLTSVGLIASVLRYNEEHPGKKLLIAGHCDTTGAVDFNQTLSEERAAVAHALLTGDRDTFCNLCHERHQVADYKQVLHWVTKALDPEVPFDCDPGTIDNQSFTGIEPVRRFQRDYNKNKTALGASAADLDEDGDIGLLTWGALFDCYEYALRQELGEDPASLAALRSELEWIDPHRYALGFSEHHPIDNLGSDGYRSQANRRVEVLFFDPGEEPDLDLAGGDPEMSDVYLPGKYEREHLPPIPNRETRRLRLCDAQGLVMASAPYTATVGAVQNSGLTDADGFAELRAPGAARQGTIRWTTAGDGDGTSIEYERVVFLRLGAGETSHVRRLENLGYVETAATLDEKLTEFRAEFNRPDEEQEVLNEMKGWHDGNDRPEPRMEPRGLVEEELPAESANFE